MFASAGGPDLTIVGQIITALGPAGATFAVMWMWLSSLRTDNKDLRGELSTSRKEAIDTLERVLPLVADVTAIVKDAKQEKEQEQRERAAEAAAILDKALKRLEGGDSR